MSSQRWCTYLVLSVWMALGCSWGAAPDEGRVTLRALGDEPLEQLSLAPRFVLSGALPVRPEDLWLVRGRISDKDLGQILAHAPGEPLATRRVPLSAWRSDEGFSLAPLVVLAPSQDYSIVALSLGELARVTTGAVSSPIWWRWGLGSLRPGGWVIHCASPPPWVVRTPAKAPSDAEVAALGRGVLEPEGWEVQLLPGFSDSETMGEAASSDLPPGAECVRFRAPEGAHTWLPPQKAAGRYFEPGLRVMEDGPLPAEPVAPEVRVVGSAAYLDLSPALVEFSVQSDDGEGQGLNQQVYRAQASTPSSLLLGQFAPGAYRLTLSTLDSRGELETQSLLFEIGQERGHPVLTEVLADPLGPEPESEWVELVNIGRAPLSLAGFVLEDSSGRSALPAVTLPPGAVGLIVRSDFVAGASGDAVPAASTIPVPVEELGDGGLANSGEAIRLLGPDGTVFSEVPAVAASAGTSVARRHLLAPDWPSSFGLHAAPGSSPGRDNAFE